MPKRTSKFIAISLLLFFAVFLVARCVPEKAVDLATKITPVQWINEDELLVRCDNRYFLYDPNGGLVPAEFDAAGQKVKEPLGIQMAPGRSNQIWSEEARIGDIRLGTDQYIEIDGDKHRVRKPSLRGRFVGINQGFPRGEYLEFFTYQHLGKVGLLTFSDDTVQKIELPLQNSDNMSSPAVMRDSVTGEFLAFQTRCLRKDPDGTCTRTAWWLDSDLKVSSSFLLPDADPLFTEEKFSCFSCGCGCYTQEDVYAVNGKAYFLYSGFPLSNSQRGLYRVVDFGSGGTEWVHEIKGRIEPPLAFSPSGCKVAYFRVSRLGDSLQVKNLCR